ncbi:MAG: magnesium transporter [Acidobacteriota bacterium]
MNMTRRNDLVGDTLRRFVRRGAHANLVKLLGKTRPEDVALQFPRLIPSEQSEVFAVLVSEFPDSAGEVLIDLDAATRQDLLMSMEPPAIAKVLDELVEIVDRKNLEQVQTHLTYGDDTAGRLMDTVYLALSEETTVGDAIKHIQGSADLDNIFYLYVVDRGNHLVGVTSLRHLLLSDPDVTLEKAMTPSVIKVRTGTDQEEVAKLAARYNLLAIPVTDDDNKLVGIVTLDDIIDVVREEATEDIFKMVGTSDDEIVYQDRSLRVAGIRLPWLLFNLGGLVLAGVLISFFEVTLKEAVFLITFVPAIMGMGGSIGSQTSTITVRGLATGRLTIGYGSMKTFLWQQFKVGSILGVVCATIVGVGAMLWEQSPIYGVVVGVSLFIAVMLASLNGVLIPIVFEKLGVDPAVAAGPLVTTSNDITGVLIYFGLATLFIDLLVR